MPTSLPLKGPHWSYALRLYAQPGASEACLALQDRFSVDVNILLFALFAAAESGIAICPHDLQDMDEAVAAWRGEVILPLRTLRRRMKQGPGPAPSGETEVLRTQIKRAEIAAEQIEQALLARWLEGRNVQQASAEIDLGAVLRTVVAHFVRATNALPTAGAVGAEDEIQTLLLAASNMRRSPIGSK